MSDKGLPDAHFGDVVLEQNDQVLDAPDDIETDDDEELEKTPPDVTAILGFDPKELDEGE